MAVSKPRFYPGFFVYYIILYQSSVGLPIYCSGEYLEGFPCRCHLLGCASLTMYCSTLVYEPFRQSGCETAIQR
mgnify:CR=1 FL=1